MDIDLHVSSQPTTLRRLVEDKLRTAILWGKFKPGQRLIERELCELTGVGRTSIREALRQLEAEGLVETVPNRGPVVAVIDIEEARELYNVRSLLEGYAGRMFALQATDEEINALDQAISQLESSIAQDNGRALMDAKTQFYEVLIRGCRNRFVSKLLTMLHNRVTLLRLRTMTQPGRLNESIREIRDIRDAIASRDPDRAERACIEHIHSAAKVALQTLVLQPQNGGERK